MRCIAYAPLVMLDLFYLEHMKIIRITKHGVDQLIRSQDKHRISLCEYTDCDSLVNRSSTGRLSVIVFLGLV